MSDDDTGDDAPRVSIHIKAVFTLPRRWTKRRRALRARLVAAAAVLSAGAEAAGPVEGDDCNLADFVAALEAMAATVRRARASRRNAGEYSRQDPGDVR